MKTYTVGKIKKKLKKDGWYLARKSGHDQYKHPVKKGTVSVEHHGDGQEIPPKTLKRIFEQAGWK
ncbi:type II toxin-antitoxin system HicA family toxin [Clostridium beijerinckii]|uniref:type II toxin-antitoxin system HicA family toxin n=1 Tax=Clostridium beijerinckii TaxID=1520 RepID=UPI00156F0577|nr:type II toxin-antitoxin system HicA family toxin [Clostridium beijerinckii]NRT72067.1 putative RNA binding protein YcfA (HicA-like mRNA interferase family) [Clostridium beijerinckii]